MTMPGDDDDAEWMSVGPLERLPKGAGTVVRAGPRRIALFRGDGGNIHAVDDQCPHEGYPLSKGSLAGHVLTCCYHNFKFDVRTGACTKGDECVAVHRTRVRNGQVEILLVEPPRDALLVKHRNSLEEALREHRLGQAARETVRLLSFGEKPANLALLAARFDAEYAEYGSTHTLPVAADVCSMLRLFPGLEAALPLMQALELASETSVRRPKRPVTPAAEPGNDPRRAGALLREHVEAERCEEAEALLRGALDKGWGRPFIEPWLLELSTDHFLGFGHALIFTVKAFDLLETVGWEHAAEILPGLLVAIVSQTREDALPEWLWFRERMAAIEPRLATWWTAKDTARPASQAEHKALVEAVLDGSRIEAFDAIHEALERNLAIHEIVDALSVAASERILRFNVAVDRDSTVQEGWLDVTHLLTFVNATRHALIRYDSANGLKWLFQAARFIHGAKPLDEEAARNRGDSPAAASLEQLGDAIRNGDTRKALEIARGYLAAARDTDEIERLCQHLTLEDRVVRPIFVAHLIKTCQAAFDEFLRAVEEEGLASLIDPEGGETLH